MNILVIGGTSFVGRHIVEAAIRNGHQITLFNRGISNPHIFPNLVHIMGDRRKDAMKLAGQKWDAVIDTCGYSPADLLPILENIDTELYVFVSTISVYSDFRSGALKETSEVLSRRIASEDEESEAYGLLKADAEKVVVEALGDSALIIRPSIIAGPYDPTDRFTYWACKLVKSEEVLIPGSEERKVQWIDARDLANFIMKQVEVRSTGTFNVAGDPVDMKTFVDAIRTSEMQAVWVDDAFLLAEGIEPFEIPLWIPITDEHPEGFITVQNTKAKRAGLVCRAAQETAEDIRESLKAIGETELNAGLGREREVELLMRYKSNNV